MVRGEREMLDRDGYPHGVPCWIDTEPSDPVAAADFYRGLFGWRFDDRTPSGAPGHYLVAELDGRAVAAVSSPDPALSSREPRWNTYVAVGRRRSRGRPDPPRRWRGGGRAVRRVGRRPHGRVPRPGRRAVPALAVRSCPWGRARERAQRLELQRSQLHDLEQAKAFYGEVFGWVPETLDLGETSATM
jgi:predicted enzyme related to lactoylglutathione lyase